MLSDSVVVQAAAGTAAAAMASGNKLCLVIMSGSPIQ
jgi:hypothetical protein